jgi:hypothetical protein
VYCYEITAVYYKDESEFSNKSCSSILNITEYNSKFNIYPNPANDKIFIESELIHHHAEIFDINGKLVINRVLDLNITTIDISNLTQGIYFIKVSNETVGKFIKE